MKKIAILCCLNANDVCAGVGCLNSFYGKDKAFGRTLRMKKNLLGHFKKYKQYYEKKN